MRPGIPLLGGRDLASTVAWHQGQAVSAGEFLAEAAALAERLPAQGQAVNLCRDRYLFAVGTVAALQRGQTSLMPPNALPDTLRQLQQPGLQPYALSDDAAVDAGGLPLRHVARMRGLTPLTTEPRVGADFDAVCLLTSGSTAAAQSHRKRWDVLQANIQAEAGRLAELLGWASIRGLNLVATVPAQHSYGFESSVLLALFAGAAFDAGRPFYPADIAEALARVPSPRALITTPFHLKTLLRARIALPRVDLVLSATAPLSPQLAMQAEATFGARLIEIYGCTEAGQVATRRTTEGEVWTTFGGLRLHAEPSAEGERYIVHGGHVVEATPLGDVLDLLDSQRFRLLGRANDLIHVAGKRSSLAHLNFKLNRIEGVDDGAFWLPDEVAEGVVRPVAFVVAPTRSAREIVSALRQQLEPAFVPRRVVHVLELPREATGKLTSASLRRFALQTLAQADQTGRGNDIG